jgi:hypothetical protein
MKVKGCLMQVCFIEIHKIFAKTKVGYFSNRRLLKNKVNFCFYQKNILFINNYEYIIPFKVIPLRYNTLVPVVFSILKELLISTLWYSLELFQRCCFYLLNRIKSQSFHGFLQFWKQEKVTGAKSGESGVVIGQKLTNKQ